MTCRVVCRRGLGSFNAGAAVVVGHEVHPLHLVKVEPFLDTSTTTTDTIDYVATDGAGLPLSPATGTATIQ